MLAVGNISGPVSTALNRVSSIAMRNAWEPRTGRTPEFAVWYDELLEVLIKFGLSEADIKEKPPEKPEDATWNMKASNHWADAIEAYQDQGTCIFDAVRGSLLHLSDYAQMDMRTISRMKHKTNGNKNGRALLGWALEFVDTSSLSCQMKLIEDLGNKKLGADASKLQLASHMVDLYDMWLQKEGTNITEPAEYLQRLLMSMPTSPEGALVRVRSRIVDMVEDNSPILQKMDGQDGFFEKVNKYAETTGVGDASGTSGGLHAMYFDQVNKHNKCKSNLCRSWVCGKLSPESCLSQAGSTFPIEDVPEGPQRDFVELSRAVSAYSPKTSLLLEAKELRHVLRDKPHVLSSLAHMTAIVGGPVLSEVSDVDDEVQAWLKENEGNGSGLFVMGGLDVGDLETETCDKMENVGGLFAFGDLEHNTKDAEASSSTKQGYQTPLPTHSKPDLALDTPIRFGDDHLLSPKELLSKFKEMAARGLTPTSTMREAALNGGALTQKIKQVQSLISLAGITSAASNLAEYIINLPKSQLTTMLLAVCALGYKFKPAVTSLINLIVSAAFKLGAEPLNSTRQRLRALFIKFMNAVSKSLPSRS